MMLGALSNNIFASTYTFYMPNKEQLINEIEKVLNSNLSIEEAVVKLIKKANLRGGTDNISIAYLKKESGEL